MELEEPNDGSMEEVGAASDYVGFPGARSVPGTVSREIAETAVRRLFERRDAPPAYVAPAPRTAQVEALCKALISPDPGAGQDMIDALCASGTSADTLYLDYIAAAARRLGEHWTDDRYGFLEVTLGAARLHAILRTLKPRFFDGAPVRSNGLRALFAPVPGEDHSLGVVMAADFFRRSGWQVDLTIRAEVDALADDLTAAPYDLVGLSGSSRVAKANLGATVAMVRRHAPGVPIAVAGQLFADHPDLAASSGVDFLVDDVASAPVVLADAVRSEVTPLTQNGTC
ncbi:MAG: cobalamin B12-binding domain-containing protein [Pseudomonadota bacterium]